MNFWNFQKYLLIQFDELHGLNGLSGPCYSFIYPVYAIISNDRITCDRLSKILNHEQTSNFCVCIFSFHLLSVKVTKGTALFLGFLGYAFYSFLSCLGRSLQLECLNSIELYTRSILFRVKIVGILTSPSIDYNYCLKHDPGVVLKLKCAKGKGVLKIDKDRKRKVSKLGMTNVYDLHNLLLMCGDVESNPGPNELRELSDRKVILKLMTQNCRGLLDRDKLRQILKNKNSELRGGKMVLALQETHLMNDTNIIWSGNYVITNSTSPHSAGCVTYFNDDVRVIEVRHIDDEGHGHVIAVEGLSN